MSTLLYLLDPGVFEQHALNVERADLVALRT